MSRAYKVKKKDQHITVMGVQGIVCSDGRGSLGYLLVFMGSHLFAWQQFLLDFSDWEHLKTSKWMNCFPLLLFLANIFIAGNYKFSSGWEEAFFCETVTGKELWIALLYHCSYRLCVETDYQTWWTRNRHIIALFYCNAKEASCHTAYKALELTPKNKENFWGFIHYFFPEILFLFVFCGIQIKTTNSKKNPKQTVGTLTCETVFACLFWRGSHSPALTFIYPHRMYSYTFSSRVPCFLWVFPQLPIQTARVWNNLCTILKMLFSH